MTSVLVAASPLMRMHSSLPDASASLSVTLFAVARQNQQQNQLPWARLTKRILSSASDALLMSSRRNTCAVAGERSARTARAAAGPTREHAHIFVAVQAVDNQVQQAVHLATRR